MNPLEARRRLLGRNVYKRTTEGNPAIAQGSLARRYPGITMQGWTEQAQYEGKNIYNAQVLESKYGGSTIDDYLDNINTNSTTPVELEPSTNYTFSINEEVSNHFDLRFYDVDGNYISSSYSSKFLTPDNTKYIIICGIKSIFSVDYKIQIEKGTSVTLYEPYTGGAPSPNPDYPQEIVSAGKYDEGTGKYQYEVKLTGANLFNPDGEIVDGSPYDGIPLNNKGIVSMSLYEKNTDVDLSDIYFGMCSEELNLNNVNWAIANGAIQAGGKIIAAEDNKYVCWYPGNVTVLQKVLSRYDVMTNYGDGVYLPYQPYKNQTVTLASDRPLTKWDKLEKRNGQWGWVYKSDEIVLDGSEDENWILAQTDNYNQFYINIDTVEHSNSEKNIYCEKFRPAVIADRETEKEIIYTARGISGAIAVSTELATELDAWKAWLQSNPITVLYRSIEETFVPLSAAEQEAMNALYTFRPTTVLSNDCECEMTLTYKTKKSLEVTT